MIGVIGWFLTLRSSCERLGGLYTLHPSKKDLGCLTSTWSLRFLRSAGLSSALSGALLGRVHFLAPFLVHFSKRVHFLAPFLVHFWGRAHFLAHFWGRAHFLGHFSGRSHFLAHFWLFCFLLYFAVPGKKSHFWLLLFFVFSLFFYLLFRFFFALSRKKTKKERTKTHIKRKKSETKRPKVRPFSGHRQKEQKKQTKQSDQKCDF